MQLRTAARWSRNIVITLALLTAAGWLAFVPSAKFNYPTDVAFGPAGALYVADGYNDRIQRFSSDGAFLTRFGTKRGRSRPV